MQLTQIVNGEVTELTLCESCAKSKGLFDPQSLSFAEQFFPEEFKKKIDDLVKELVQQKDEEKRLSEPAHSPDMLTRCPVCDFTLEQYRKTERLGCPDCYSVFSAEIHAGLAEQTDLLVEEPGAESPAIVRKKLEQLLQAAIEREDYGTAAKLRDELKKMA
jgi:protein arginine kinase activator